MKKKFGIAVRVLCVLLIGFGVVIVRETLPIPMIIISIFALLFIILSIIMDFIDVKKINKDFRIYCFMFFSGFSFAVFAIIAGIYLYVTIQNRIYIKVLSPIAVIGSLGVLVIIVPSFISTVRHYIKYGEIKIKRIGKNRDNK